MGTLIYILVHDAIVTKDAGDNFAYFTILTYIGICSYYWASFVQTLCFIRRNYEGYPLQNWWKTLQVLHLMLQNTIMNLPIIVTVAFWALLSSPTTLSTPFLAWRNISIHILNSVFCVFEILFTNNPPPRWINLPFMILLIGLYTAYAYLVHATQGFYPYKFLDPSEYHEKVGIYIAGIIVGEIVIFVIVWGLMKLRHKIFPAKKDGGIPVQMKELERGRAPV
ncbi:hypothetical protein V5O48_003912 [Marasmius crinis-equi]|uniref:Uncharacterized protein n=1 Tax=Marasmius crinis-equi TaxID=585013 RepID=A0ABR3FRL3_9AGAR